MLDASLLYLVTYPLGDKDVCLLLSSPYGLGCIAVGSIA